MKRTYHRLKKEVGDIVIKKYNSRCVSCGTGKDICVHHIEKMDVDDKRYNDVDNLVLLCRSCHMRHHRKEGDIKPPPPPSGNKYGRRGKRPPIKCKLENCDEWQHARMLCKKHYERFRRAGKLIQY